MEKDKGIKLESIGGKMEYRIITIAYIVVNVCIFGCMFFHYKELFDFPLLFKSNYERVGQLIFENVIDNSTFWGSVLVLGIVLTFALMDKIIIGVVCTLINILFLISVDWYGNRFYMENKQSFCYEKIRVVVMDISPIQKPNLGKVTPSSPTIVTAFDGKDVIENIVLSRDRNSIKLQDTVVVVKSMIIRDFDKKVLSVRYSL